MGHIPIICSKNSKKRLIHIITYHLLMILNNQGIVSRMVAIVNYP